MTWENNTPKKITLTSKYDVRKKIIYKKKQVIVDLKNGRPTKIEF